MQFFSVETFQIANMKLNIDLSLEKRKFYPLSKLVFVYEIKIQVSALFSPAQQKFTKFFHFHLISAFSVNRDKALG